MYDSFYFALQMCSLDKDKWVLSNYERERNKSAEYHNI